MKTSSKVLVGVGIAAVVSTAGVIGVARAGDDGVPVRMAEVERRDLVSTVIASGNIRARSAVDISSDISARIERLHVREGDDVEAGAVLLELDRSQYEAARSRAEAALSQAEAQLANTRATLLGAQRDFQRTQALYQRDSLLVSQQQLDEAETNLEVARANMEASLFGVRQAEASLAEAADRLSKTVIRAPATGKVTRLNVEEGETVMIGTMNNPGSLILTLSDLSTIEVVVQVDETDVPHLELGDSASVEIDAFPDRPFSGRVTEIGNSAIQPPSGVTGNSQSAIDFEVVITLDETPRGLRSDLSATAEIVTEERDGALSIPIIALTVRDREEVASEAGTPAAEREVEGVFLVEGGTVTFTPVEIGITGKEHFEVVSGLQEGDTVVAGPYQVVRELGDGDRVTRRSDDAAGDG